MEVLYIEYSNVGRSSMDREFFVKHDHESTVLEAVALEIKPTENILKGKIKNETTLVEDQHETLHWVVNDCEKQHNRPIQTDYVLDKPNNNAIKAVENLNNSSCSFSCNNSLTLDFGSENFYSKLPQDICLPVESKLKHSDANNSVLITKKKISSKFTVQPATDTSISKVDSPEIPVEVVRFVLDDLINRVFESKGDHERKEDALQHTHLPDVFVSHKESKENLVTTTVQHPNESILVKPNCKMEGNVAIKVVEEDFTRVDTIIVDDNSILSSSSKKNVFIPVLNQFQNSNNVSTDKTSLLKHSNLVLENITSGSDICYQEPIKECESNVTDGLNKIADYEVPSTYPNQVMTSSSSQSAKDVPRMSSRREEYNPMLTGDVVTDVEKLQQSKKLLYDLTLINSYEKENLKTKLSISTVFCNNPCLSTSASSLAVTNTTQVIKPHITFPYDHQTYFTVCPKLTSSHSSFYSNCKSQQISSNEINSAIFRYNFSAHDCIPQDLSENGSLSSKSVLPLPACDIESCRSKDLPISAVKHGFNRLKPFCNNNSLCNPSTTGMVLSDTKVLVGNSSLNNVCEPDIEMGSKISHTINSKRCIFGAPSESANYFSKEDAFSNEFPPDRSDGSDSGLGSEIVYEKNIKQPDSQSSDELCNTLTNKWNSDIQALPSTSKQEWVLKSNLKRTHEDCNVGPQAKKMKKSIDFQNVSIFYFPRTQGFTCIPSQVIISFVLCYFILKMAFFSLVYARGILLKHFKDELVQTITANYG